MTCASRLGILCQTGFHATHADASMHFRYPIISFASRSSPRKSDLTSTTCCSEAEAASASACSAGQVLLGRDASTLARMEAGIDPGSARDGRPVASDGIQAVLEVAFAASNRCGQEVREQG